MMSVADSKGTDDAGASTGLRKFFSKSSFPSFRDFHLKTNFVVPAFYVFSEHSSTSWQIAKDKRVLYNMCICIKLTTRLIHYILPLLSKFLDMPLDA